MYSMQYGIIQRALQDCGAEVEDSVSSVNWGGCGFYAYYLGDALVRLLPHAKARIIIAGHDYVNAASVRMYMRRLKISGHPPSGTTTTRCAA